MPDHSPLLIIFDLDDTLLDTRGGSIEALASTCAVAALHYPGLDGDRIRMAYDAVVHETDLRLAAAEMAIPTIDELHLHRWSETLKRCGAEGTHAEALARHYHECRRGNYRLFTEVDGSLDEVQKRFAMAILTNGPGDLQREKIETVRLDKRFERIYITGEVGIWKPDPAVFRHVLAETGFEPGAAVMIGDSLLNDIAGAAAAGIRTVWINRWSQQLDPDIVPDATMEDLRPLPDLLERWSLEAEA